MEWQEGADVHDAKGIADQHSRRAMELIAAGKEEVAFERICQTTRLSRQEARRRVEETRRIMEDGAR